VKDLQRLAVVDFLPRMLIDVAFVNNQGLSAPARLVVARLWHTLEHPGHAQCISIGSCEDSWRQ